MRKKVVFCESGYNIFYGAQQSLYNFLINADKELLEIVVLTPDRGIFTEELENRNITVEIVNYPEELNRTGSELRKGGINKKFKMLLGIGKYIKNYIKYFKKNRDIDLVYCNDIRSILTCGLAAKLSGIPVLWYVRIDKRLGIFNHIGANIANKIVVIADNVKKIFNAQYIWNSKNKFRTVYTGIDLDSVDQVVSDNSLKKQYSIEFDMNLVGIIASIQPRKGQKDLINSIVQLQKNKSLVLDKTRFLIIGDILNDSEIRYLEEIKEIITENNLMDYVYFLGWRQDVLSIMKELDLIVLPSYSEGLPRTVLESLACSCPVIATDVAGTGEIIEHKANGMLIKPGDVNALSEALEYMLIDKTKLRQMGIEGRKTIENKFLMEKYVNDLQDIIIKTVK